MKETLKLTLTLTLICLVAGGLLAAADALTRDRIAMVNQQRRQAALNAVLPQHDNQPLDDAVTVTHADRDWTFYTATKDGVFAGAAVETGSPNGYGGTIRLMFGIGADGKSIGIAILEQKETPGLGANIETPDFKQRLADRDIKQTHWNVKKDGGDIDHITAATISSRAVTDAVRGAVEAYLANEQMIANGGK
jgi:electron transport complex protein RnfG